MQVKTLYAIGKAGNCFNAHAPDYPGCVGAGKTAMEAKNNLVSALRLHISAMISDGDDLPEEDLDGGFITVDVPEVNRKAPGDKTLAMV